MSALDKITDPDANPARPPPGQVLCSAEEVEAGKIRRFLFKAHGREFRGLVVEAGGVLHGYIDWCPHDGVALQDDRDPVFREQGLIVCAWHWARFSPVDGKGVDGPCFEGLHPWPVDVGADGMLRTAPWRDG